MDIRQTGLSRELLKLIADSIPPGGHMMIEYDSPVQQETADLLRLGVPPAATPLGYLLYSIGFGAGFKDWHFAEGGSEGPRKLQGFKPLNQKHAQEGVNGLAKELLNFSNSPTDFGHSGLGKAARQRAVEILGSLDIGVAALKREIKRTLTMHDNAASRRG